MIHTVKHNLKHLNIPETKIYDFLTLHNLRSKGLNMDNSNGHMRHFLVNSVEESESIEFLIENSILVTTSRSSNLELKNMILYF